MGVMWIRSIAAAVIAFAIAVGSAVVGTTATAAPAMAATTAQQALSQAGNGWALAMYASGQDTYRSRVTLYLTSPAGAAYALRSWPHGTR